MRKISNSIQKGDFKMLIYADAQSDRTSPPKPPANIEMQDGFLTVRAVSSVDDSPLPRATVMIYSEDRGRPQTQKVLETGVDGNTEKMTLPAPAKKYSLSATSVVVPYSRYTIRVEFPGFYTNVYKNAQVFADTTTTQESRMDPLPFGVKNVPGLEKIYTIPSQFTG
jgi:hypothetical protein